MLMGNLKSALQARKPQAQANLAPQGSIQFSQLSISSATAQCRPGVRQFARNALFYWGFSMTV